jgi:hypothetical protein
VDSTGSMLKTIIERIRGFLDDPDLEAKYSDDYIVRHIISPAYASVLSRVNNSATNPVIQNVTFPLVKNQKDYQLPPAVGEVLRLAISDEAGRVIQEAMPRGFWNLRGPNWQIQGNMISFTPLPPETYTNMELWYIPSGDYKPFYSLGGADHQLAADTDGNLTQITINVSTAASVGEVDRRPSAYVGQMLRIIPTSTSGVIEERVIGTWAQVSGTSWKATVRKGFTSQTAGNMPPFEIAQEGSENMFEAVAAAGALKLATYRRLNGEHFGMIQAAYRDAMKTLMDHYASIQMRLPKSWEKDTVDNQLTQPWRI